MKRFAYIAIAAVGIFGSGCATNIKVHIPYAQLEAPDASGTNGKFHFGLNATPGKDINVIKDAATRPPTFNQEYKHTGLEPSLRAGIGLFRAVDLSLQYGLSNVPLLKAKWQILGSSMTEPQDNDLLFAVYGRAGYSEDDESGDQMTTFGDGGYPWKGKANIAITGGGASLGYRFQDGFMMYVGAAYDNYHGSAKVTQDRSDNGSSAGGVYSQSHDGYSRSAGVGFKWGSHVNFGVYALGTQFRWNGLKGYDDVQGGFEFTIALK